MSVVCQVKRSSRVAGCRCDEVEAEQVLWGVSDFKAVDKRRLS